MCGRFIVYSAGEQLRDLLGVPDMPVVAPRYNITVTHDIVAARWSERRGGRFASVFRWGLIPSWAKEPSIGARTFNARAESLHEKPAFREAFARRRCLIPTDGYYEWKHDGPFKQPYLIHMADERPFAFAGLWERWKQGSALVESCTIITTAPNRLVAEFHDRMPAIIRPEDFALWLDPDVRDPERLRPLLEPFPAEQMAARPVSPRVNKVGYDGADLIEPYRAPVQQSLF